MKKNLFIFLFIYYLCNTLIGQPLPLNNFSNTSTHLLYNIGSGWESLSLFGPIRLKVNNDDQRNFKYSININSQINFYKNINSYPYLESYFILNFKNNYYAYSRPRLYKSKNGGSINFESNRSNIFDSGVGYENDWVLIQYSRGKQSWGTGNNIQLSLSENSENYDYLLLGSDYGKIRVRYIYGFLEKIDNNINRYITARGIEWTNKKSFLLGFSETVIYSGKNRLPDLGYLNPIGSHLEIELNNRLNTIGVESANAVWQLHFDCFFKKKFRVSLNYLIDEFVIDSKIQIGKEHGKAFSSKIAYSPISSKVKLVTLYCNFIYVGTPTFRHRKGTNNFIQNGKPLGWPYGSDGREINFGINYFNKNNLILCLSHGYYQIGEESLVNNIFDTYSDYLKGPFPSGVVKSNYFFNFDISYIVKNKYSIYSGVQYSKKSKNFDFGVSYDF